MNANVLFGLRVYQYCGLVKCLLVQQSTVNLGDLSGLGKTENTWSIRRDQAPLILLTSIQHFPP
jgi:hypothetical protein